jgi:cytochrome c oxidase assembly protein subunit 19
MSMGSSWQNFSTPTPPERGSFPLDFYGECNEFVRAYMNCLKSNKNDAMICKPLSKKYLQCRMDKGLMEKEDLRKLGFRDEK